MKMHYIQSLCEKSYENAFVSIFILKCLIVRDITLTSFIITKVFIKLVFILSLFIFYYNFL